MTICTFCRGNLKSIEAPTAEAGFRCVSCGAVDTAAKMMVRALEKAIRIQIEVPSGSVITPGREDRGAVDAFLKSLGKGPQV